MTIANNLGVAYARLGKFSQAAQLLEQTLKIRRAKLPPDHPDTLDTMDNLAAAYFNMGELDQVEQLREETLRRTAAKLGPAHRHTLISMSNLALTYLHGGKAHEAVKVYGQALEGSKKALGDDHTDTLWILFGLGQAYRAAGQPTKAEPVLEETVARFAKKWGKKGAETLMVLGYVGLNLLDQKRFTDAERIFRECMATRVKGDGWVQASYTAHLGAALLGQKKYTEAEPLLLSGYQGMKERETAVRFYNKIRAVEAAQRLVQLYEALGQKDKAAEWRVTKMTGQLSVDLQTARGAARYRFAEASQTGSLTSQDKSCAHRAEMTAGKTYVLDLESKAFDTFLVLKDSSGKKLAENDDITRTNCDSRIVFAPSKSGTFEVVATSFEERETGPYVLRIRELISKVNGGDKQRK